MLTSSHQKSTLLSSMTKVINTLYQGLQQFIEEMPKTQHRALTAQQQHNTCLTHVTILHSTSQLRKISN
jgi:hypothetical protein